MKKYLNIYHINTTKTALQFNNTLNESNIKMINKLHNIHITIFAILKSKNKKEKLILL